MQPTSSSFSDITNAGVRGANASAGSPYAGARGGPGWVALDREV